MKKLLLLLFLFSPAWATTTITGNLKNLGGSAISLGTFVRFYLRGCSGNQPRINGTAIIGPTLGNVYFVDLLPNASGAISGIVYSTTDATGTGNGEIECGGLKSGLWYGMVPFLNGKSGPETPIAAKNTVTLDISNVTPLTVNPVVLPPAGDTTYARLDGGNQPFTGGVQAPNFDNACYVDGSTHTTLASCVTAVGSSGFIVLPPSVSNYIVSANLSIPGGVGLWVQPGAVIQINTGVTLTVNGEYRAEPTSASILPVGTGKILFPSSGQGPIWVTWWANSDFGIQLQQAYASCAQGGCQFSIPCGTYSMTTYLTITTVAMKLWGSGKSCTLINLLTATGSVFTLQANNLEFRDFTVEAGPGVSGAITRTAGAVFSVTGGATSRKNTYTNIEFIDTYGGYDFEEAGGSDQTINNGSWLSNGPNTLHNGTLLKIAGGSGGALGDIIVNSFNSYGDISIHDAALLLIDTGADTIKLLHWDVNSSQGAINNTSPGILIQNTIGGGTHPPRFLKFIGGSIEANPQAECMRITGGQNIDFNSFYFASCKTVNVVGPGAGIHFISDIFENMQNDGIIIGPNGSLFDVQVINSIFDDISASANASFVGINVGPGPGAVTDFKLIGNHCLANIVLANANKPGFCIVVSAAASDRYVITGNVVQSGATATGNYSDGGTGSNKWVCGNQPSSACNIGTGFYQMAESTAPSAAAGTEVCYGDSTAHALKCSYNNGTFFNQTQTVVVTGTKALNTASITTATCDAGVAATANGAASTDTVNWSFNAAPTATNKYGAFLVVYAVPSANTVTFYTCNPSATTSTPTAMTVNFSVTR